MWTLPVRRRLVLLVTTIVCLAFFLAPRVSTYNKAVCYWKTAQRELIESADKLDSIGCKTVYVKYFDVGLAPDQYPSATAYFNADTLQTRKFAQRFEVVPCVFISSESDQRIPDDSIDALGWLIAKRVLKMHAYEFQTEPSRVLIDYDWTEASRITYFKLLKSIQRFMPRVAVECSLRLWQFKARENNIPPVQRVLLMCYNMGSPSEYSPQNKIFSASEMKKYISTVNGGSYPLSVDVAFPAFSWAAAFTEGRFRGLLEGYTHADFTDTSIYTHSTNGMYRLKDEAYIGRDVFEPGTEFRVDQVSAEEVREVAQYIQSVLPHDNKRTITLYSWKHETEERFGLAGLNMMFP